MSLSPRAAWLALLLLALFLGIAALSLDVVRTGFGIKGDEATYVSMALSVAYDGDLTYERRDLERFWHLYRTGPQGIFLKRGQFLRVSTAGSFPFVRVTHRPDRRNDRLYFGKAFAYALFAAPFVRLAGLNGLLLLNVLLWVLCTAVGYWLLRARSPGAPALLFSFAFFGASITPLYIVWLTPEILHFALVFVAYASCFARDLVPDGPGRLNRFCRGTGALWLGALLLGVATFSKPPNLLLVGPPMVLLWHQRQWKRGLAFGVLAGVTIASCFAINAAVSGDFNYQGGDRRTYYGGFPFQDVSRGFDTAGVVVSTNELDVSGNPDQEGFWRQLGLNSAYFLLGRHSGFVPYFFPGVVVVALWVARPGRARRWQWAVAGAVVASAMLMLLALPHTWAGGGGPPGNRYFLSIYPALFFLTPAMASTAPAVLATLGGALFVAHVLVNPFVAAKSPWQNAQRGLLRQLPVELTMVNDLPVMLNGSRARVPYGADPVLLLYLLDEHTFLPEPAGLWVAGGETSEIIVRTDERLDRFDITLRTLVPNEVRVSAGGAAREVEIRPGAVTTVSVPAASVTTRGAHAYLLRVSTSDGAVPALTDPNSRDSRHLGVLMEIRGHRASAAAGE